MLTTRVRDLMRSVLFTCPPQTTLGEAADLLTRHRVHALIVADPAGLPLGVLSDIDLLAGEWLGTNPANLATMRAMTAGELMTAPAASIDAGAPAVQAADRMRAGRIHRLVVTEMERAVGVIAVSDLVNGLAPRVVERRTVADAMSRGLVTCRADTPVAAAARAMGERRTRSVVVVSAHGQPLGVVTGFDLLAYCGEGDPTEPVSRVMHPPLTIAPHASLREAADLMLSHHVHRLLVVDPAEPDSMPLGLISTSDIVVEMAASGSVWRKT
jgi:CBS domain-containing protein